MAEIVVRGGPELHAALTGLERDLDDLETLNRQVAGDLARAVAGTAPKVTGRLAGSFTPSATKDTATAESTLDYAGAIESGVPAHNIEGQHYAERALEQSSSGVEAKYRAGLEGLCRKADR